MCFVALYLDIAGSGFGLHPPGLDAAFVDVHGGFFDLGRGEGAQVVRGFQPAVSMRVCTCRPVLCRWGLRCTGSGTDPCRSIFVGGWRIR